MSDRRALVAAAAGFALLALIVSAAGVGQRFELSVRDRLMRLRGGEPARSVAVVAIDDASLAARGPWPWSRGELAEVIDAAFASGAVAVAVDILLVEPTPEDARLAEALGRGDALLLAGIGTGGELLLPPAELSEPVELVHGVLELDGDGVLRRLSPTKQTESVSYTAMSVAAASRARRELVVPVGRELIPAFRVRPDDVRRVGASELLAGREGDALKRRVVFVGVTATGLGDRVITPVTRRGRLDPGVIVHATVAEELIRGDLVRSVPPWIVALCAAMLVVASWMAGRLAGATRMVGMIFVIAIPLVAGAGIFLVLDVALPIVLLTLTSVAGALLVGVRSLRSVEEGVGRATRALGAESDLHGSPAERVRKLEELADEIARERRQASESHRAVAHELRTPLTSIRGLAKLLADYDLSDDERKRVAGMVAEESTRLHGMVEGLLDLERLALRERGEGLQRIDIQALLAKRAELARAVGTHVISLECPAALSLNADAALLERMIENLVGNAMKFSPPGSVVSLRAVRVDDGVVIEVDDEGPGIPAEERERVLRRFGRGRAAAETPGLGLGLAFVAEIARWHGGRVEVDEGARGGACLRVRLPAGAPAADAKESNE